MVCSRIVSKEVSIFRLWKINLKWVNDRIQWLETGETEKMVQTHKIRTEERVKLRRTAGKSKE